MKNCIHELFQHQEKKFQLHVPLSPPLIIHIPGITAKYASGKTAVVGMKQDFASQTIVCFARRLVRSFLVAYMCVIVAACHHRSNVTYTVTVAAVTTQRGVVNMRYPPIENPTPAIGLFGRLDLTCSSTSVRSSMLFAEYVRAVCRNE